MKEEVEFITDYYELAKKIADLEKSNENLKKLLKTQSETFSNFFCSLNSQIGRMWQTSSNTINIEILNSDRTYYLSNVFFPNAFQEGMTKSSAINGEKSGIYKLITDTNEYNRVLALFTVWKINMPLPTSEE